MFSDGMDDCADDPQQAPAHQPEPGYTPEQSVSETDDGDGVDDSVLDEDFSLRMEVATLYQGLMAGALFDEETLERPAARTVRRKVRAFVQQQLKELFGVRAAPEAQPVQQQFNEDEVKILKAIARKTKQAAQASGQPTVVAVTPAAPVVVPVVQKPQPKPPAAAPARPQQPSPPKPKPPGVAARPQQPKDEVISEEGTENSNERVVTKREGGRIIKQFWKGNKMVNRQDVTGQVRPTSALAMPNPQMMTLITQQQALDSIQTRVASMAQHGDRSANKVIGDVIASLGGV